MLDEHNEIVILGVLAVHPGMYLSELCTYIHSATGTLVSNSTICRVLKRHGYTRKKIQHIALQRCEHLRAQFVAEVLRFFSLDKFVWIDECGCSHRDAVRKVGYALRGMTPTCTQLLIRKGASHALPQCIVILSCIFWQVKIHLNPPHDWYQDSFWYQDS